MEEFLPSLRFERSQKLGLKIYSCTTGPLLCAAFGLDTKVADTQRQLSFNRHRPKSLHCSIDFYARQQKFPIYFLSLYGASVQETFSVYTPDNAIRSEHRRTHGTTDLTSTAVMTQSRRQGC
jgi:hypothetical protein